MIIKNTDDVYTHTHNLLDVLITFLHLWCPVFGIRLTQMWIENKKRLVAIDNWSDITFFTI